MEEQKPLLSNQLQLAVEVLTSKQCSEEGLEDATSLLLQLSKTNAATRLAVLSLLLQGARQLGLVICDQIRYVSPFKLIEMIVKKCKELFRT